MSEHNKVLTNFFDSGYDIYLDELYYISYSDQEQIVALGSEKFNKNYEKYLAIMSWPDTQLKFKSVAELPPEQNPNFIKVTGRMLIEWVEKGFVPQFDKFFDKSRRLLMIPIEAYDHFNQYSKMLKKGRR